MTAALVGIAPRPPVTPRFATKRDPSRYSDGPRVGAGLAQLGRPPKPSQQEALDVALERLDGPRSRWAYSEIIWIVGRRWGKTLTEMGIPLTLALDGPLTLPDGRRIPYRAAHTAQNLVRARERFLEDLAEPYIATVPERLRRTRTDLLINIASTSLTLDPIDVTSPDAAMIQVYAPTVTAMRSAGLAHICIDETLVFDAEKGGNLLAAARPTMATMKGLAQMWLLSNVGTVMGTWLPELRDRGRAAVTSGVREGTCYLEYSMPDDADPADEDVWWQCYPSLAEGLVDIRELREDLRILGLDAFAAEYLNRWPAGDVGTPVLDPNTWLRLVRPDARIVPGSPMAGGVDVTPDGQDLMIVACGHDTAGRWVVEVAEHLPFAGQRLIADQLIAWHKARPNLAGIGYDPKTCATAAHWATDAHVPMVAVEGARWGQALTDLNDRVAGGLAHPHGVGEPGPDVLLRHLAAARSKQSGESTVLSRTASRGPISGVVALQLAIHAAGRLPAPKPAFTIR